METMTIAYLRELRWTVRGLHHGCKTPLFHITEAIPHRRLPLPRRMLDVPLPSVMVFPLVRFDDYSTTLCCSRTAVAFTCAEREGHGQHAVWKTKATKRACLDHVERRRPVLNRSEAFARLNGAREDR